MTGFPNFIGRSFDQICFVVRDLDSAIDALERLGGEAAALAAEARALAHRRQAALQDLARASLSRMGLGQFDASAAPPAADGDKALEVLHMRTCDLVRRAVLLLCALEKARS